MLTIFSLTHWRRVTDICVGNLAFIGSDNCLSPDWGKLIIWTNAGILYIGPLGTNFSETLNEIHTFSFKEMYLKMLPVKWRPFCLSLNVLKCNKRSSDKQAEHSIWRHRPKCHVDLSEGNIPPKAIYWRWHMRAVQENCCLENIVNS